MVIAEKRRRPIRTDFELPDLELFGGNGLPLERDGVNALTALST